MLPEPMSIVRTLARLLRSGDAREDLAWEWRRRRAGEPALPAGGVRRIVVLCHGNLCRSPFAAALLAADRCLDVRSAGVGAGDGEPADPTAARVALRFGIDLAAHRTHRVRAQDAQWADLLLGMEGRHAAALRRAFPEAAPRVRLLGDFLEEAPHRILDPWGQSEAVFEDTFHRIVRATNRLRERIGNGLRDKSPLAVPGRAST